jgi:hypothetical protein
VTNNAGNTNFNFLDFGENIGGRAILATIDGNTHGQITASPCGGSAVPGGSSCSVGNDPNHVIIRMRNATDTGGLSFIYFVAVVE